MKTDPRRKYLVYSTKVKIGPHNVKAKNKPHLHGRIQVTVDRKWIDRKAKIIVRIPVHSRGLDAKHS